MLKRVSINSQNVKVGDMLFTGGTPSRVIGFDPYPDFKKLCPGLTARIARVDTGRDMTLIDNDTCDVLRYEIDGLVYADQRSYEADKARLELGFKLQVKNENPNWS